MNLLHVRAELFNKPLLITPSYADVVTTVLADRLGIEPAVSSDPSIDYRRPSTRPVVDQRTGIAVYPIVGSMVHRGGMLDANSVSMAGYTTIQRDLTALLNDPEVKQILLDLDTPGGQASGIIELADFIQRASKEKPIWGIANTSACSGGYWLGASCQQLVAAPMAHVGSIGVVTMHVDVSKSLEKRGIVQTFVYAGAHKIDGHPYGPLPDGVKADMQASVNGLYDQFVGAVAQMRGMDESAVRQTEAGVFDPAQALELGLVDAQGTLGATLQMMTEQYRPRTSVRGITLESSMITQADLDNAKAQGFNDGKLEGVKLGHAEGVKATCTAISGLVPGNVAIESFVEALNDGASLTVATKTATRVATAQSKADLASQKTETKTEETKPEVTTTRTQAEVDAFMKGHSPDVKNDASQQLSAQEKRKAELSSTMKGHNRAKGYTAA